MWPYLVVYVPPSRWSNPYWQFLQWALFVWPCCVGVCGLAFRSLWMTDAVRYNGSLNERAIVPWMYASGPKLVGCVNTRLNGFFHMEGVQLAEVCKYEKNNNNANIYVCTITTSYTLMRSSSKTPSSPSAPVKRPFIHAANTPHSHFPTHSFYPLSHRPLASPAARINAQFPFGKRCTDSPLSRRRCQPVSMASWLTDAELDAPFQPMADQSQVVMRRPRSGQLSTMLGRKRGWIRRQRAHTRIAMDHSATQSVKGSLLGLSVLMWCFIYVAIVSPPL